MILYQIGDAINFSPMKQEQISVMEMTFDNEDRGIWNNCIKDLQDFYIHLMDREDDLIQSMNFKGGSYKISLGYIVILEGEDIPKNPWLILVIWKLNWSLKVNLFLWLDLHNKMHVRVLLLKDIGLALVVFLFVR